MKKPLLFLSLFLLSFWSFSQTTIWEEDFEAATMPTGWEQFNDGTSSGTHDWTFGSGDMPAGGDFSTNAAIFDDTAAGNTGLHDRRWLRQTVGINASSFENLYMGYEYAVQDFNGAGKLIVAIYYSENNAGWGIVAEYDNIDQDPIYVEVDLEPLIASLPIDRADIRIGFIYDDEDSGWNWGAGIGYVKISGDIVNDWSNDALAIEVGAIGSDCTNPMIASNVDATTSPQATPSCGNFAGGDVWYKFVAPTSGEVKVVVPVVGQWSSFAHALYDDWATGANEIDCEVNYDINNSSNVPSEVIYSGLTSGMTYYFRTWDYGNDHFGVVSFCIIEVDTSGIAEAIIDGFSMYPNPVENSLNLSASHTIEAISIYNMLGQEVLQSLPATTQVELDMTSLSTGSYIVKVQAGNQVGSYNLIKQ